MAGRTPSAGLAPSTSLTPSESITPTPTGSILDDYEFVADVDNHYRVSVINNGTVIAVYTDAITPVLGGQVWLKSIARPFLNRQVQIASAGDQTRRTRGQVFDIVGRSLGVAVTDLRGGKQYELVIQTSTADEASDLDYTLAAGDVMFLQLPQGYPVPSGYYAVGDVTQSWRGLPPVQNPTRWFTLPLIQVAAPDPSVVGTVANWISTANAAASWTDLVALAATWADVAERVAGADDVIVE